MKSPRERASRLAYQAATLALAGTLLYFSLRGLAWRRVGSLILRVHPFGVLLVLGIASLTLLIRAVRWRVLLSAQAPVSIPVSFWANCAGSLGNNLLPARAGELVRTVLIGSQANASKTSILTTVLAERVADALALMAVAAAALLMLPVRPGWLAAAAVPVGILGICGALGLAFIPILESFWFGILAHLPLSESIRGKLHRTLDQALEGLRSFHDRGRLLRFLALTLSIWALDATATVVGAGAMGLRIGYPAALLLLAGLGLSSALPSAPAHAGIYQFVAVTVLAPFGVRQDEAIAYVLLFQPLGILVLAGWGLVGLGYLRGSFSIRGAGRTAGDTACCTSGTENIARSALPGLPPG